MSTLESIDHWPCWQAIIGLSSKTLVTLLRPTTRSFITGDTDPSDYFEAIMEVFRESLTTSPQLAQATWSLIFAATEARKFEAERGKKVATAAMSASRPQASMSAQVVSQSTAPSISPTISAPSLSNGRVTPLGPRMKMTGDSVSQTSKAPQESPAPSAPVLISLPPLPTQQQPPTSASEKIKQQQSIQQVGAAAHHHEPQLPTTTANLSPAQIIDLMHSPIRKSTNTTTATVVIAAAPITAVAPKDVPSSEILSPPDSPMIASQTTITSSQPALGRGLTVETTTVKSSQVSIPTSLSLDSSDDDDEMDESERLEMEGLNQDEWNGESPNEQEDESLSESESGIRFSSSSSNQRLLGKERQSSGNKRPAPTTSARAMMKPTKEKEERFNIGDMCWLKEGLAKTVWWPAVVVKRRGKSGYPVVRYFGSTTEGARTFDYDCKAPSQMKPWVQMIEETKKSGSSQRWSKAIQDALEFTTLPATAQKQDCLSDIPPTEIYMEYEERLWDLLDRLRELDEHDDFAKPVDVKVYPEYLRVIEKPMDFEKMRNKLRSRHYLSFQEFEDDFLLIVNNCITFNKDDNSSYFVELASRIKNRGIEIINSVKPVISALPSFPIPLPKVAPVPKPKPATKKKKSRSASTVDGSASNGGSSTTPGTRPKFAPTARKRHFPAFASDNTHPLLNVLADAPLAQDVRVAVKPSSPLVLQSLPKQVPSSLTRTGVDDGVLGTAPDLNRLKIRIHTGKRPGEQLQGNEGTKMTKLDSEEQWISQQ